MSSDAPAIRLTPMPPESLPTVSLVLPPDPALVETLPQRQRLLLGMAQEVARAGYRGATITDVVRFARVSKRTFYEEFTDKEQCFLELYVGIARDLERLITAATRQPGLNWREQIAAGSRAYIAALALRPQLTTAFFVEISTVSETAAQTRRAMTDHFCELIIQLIEEGRADYPNLRSRPLTPVLTQAVVGGMTELIIGALERDAMVESVDELAATAADLLTVVTTGKFPGDPDD